MLKMNSILEKVCAQRTEKRIENPLKIAFLGDSVTHGCFETWETNGQFDGSVDYENVYHARLKRMLDIVFPKCPVTIINAGIGGDNTAGGLARVQKDVIDHNPDIAIVCYGLNDVGGGMVGLEGYKKNLSLLFGRLQAAKIKTIFLTPNMMCTSVSPEYPKGGICAKAAASCSRLQTEGVMDLYMEDARQVSRENEVELCDCYADWKKLEQAGADITSLLANHINHPTREMHALFAARLFETLVLE